MAEIRFRAPEFQNWSCHNCGGCCRQHLIVVTEEERQRILKQNWSEPEIGLAPLAPHGKGWRLAHQSDGACVFLDEKGLCRIHSKHGEAAKPLACRIFPYTFHPGGNRVVVSLRFSCPSVVRNQGMPVARQNADLRRMIQAVAPSGVEEISAPPLAAKTVPEWPDFFRFIEAIDGFLADEKEPVPTRLIRIIRWLDAVEQAHFDEFSGAALGEVLTALSRSSREKISTASVNAVEVPTSSAFAMFRMLVCQYARRDTFKEVEAGLKYRLKMFVAAIRFSRGNGRVPPLQERFKPVPFEAIEKPFGPLTSEMNEILGRFFRVKVQGLHFCGPAFYRWPLISGLRALILILPVTLWMARWLALSRGRDQLAVEDVADALSIADHHHGYTAILGSRNFRRRVDLLAQKDEIARLVAHYSR
jgi:lysine-N-methylase